MTRIIRWGRIACFGLSVTGCSLSVGDDDEDTTPNTGAEVAAGEASGASSAGDTGSTEQPAGALSPNAGEPEQSPDQMADPSNSALSTGGGDSADGPVADMLPPNDGVATNPDPQPDPNEQAASDPATENATDPDVTDAMTEPDGPTEQPPEEPVTQEPSEDCMPDYDCDPEPPNSGDPYADCVDRVNQFRACACLEPLERNFDAEACMDQQAEYDSSRSAHAGFSDRICMPSGNAQNECPGWRDTEQVIEGCIRSMYYEGPPPTEPCEGQCYQEHGHFINMTDTRVTSVACGFYDAGGELWSVQNFFR